MSNINTYLRWLNSEWSVYGTINKDRKDLNTVTIDHIRASYKYNLGGFEALRGRVTIPYDEMLDILKNNPPKDQKLVHALMCWINDVDLEYRNVTA